VPNLQVENEPNLIKDSQSSAVVNTDLDGYLNYLNKRQSLKSEKEKITQIQNDINSIVSDITEIKATIKGIIATINNIVLSNRE
jgi:predicted transcriptional regulator